MIGVTYDIVQEKFFWLDDGSPVGPLDQYNVTSVIYPSDKAKMSDDMYEDPRFIVYALPDNWRGKFYAFFYEFINCQKTYYSNRSIMLQVTIALMTSTEIPNPTNNDKVDQA